MSECLQLITTIHNNVKIMHQLNCSNVGERTHLWEDD